MFNYWIFAFAEFYEFLAKNLCAGFQADPIYKQKHWFFQLLNIFNKNSFIYWCTIILPHPFFKSKIGDFNIFDF